MTCIGGGKRDPWSPYLIPRSLIAAWWDADDTADGAVATWTDRINGLALTATAGIQPISAVAGAGVWPVGKRALTFDGVDDCLSSTVMTTIPTGATPSDNFIIGQNTDPAVVQTRIALRYGAAGAPNSRFVGRNNGANGPAQVSDGTTALFGLTGVNLLMTKPFILEGYWFSTTEGGRTNGQDFTPTATATIATLNSTATRTRIGASNGATANSFWMGPMRHVFIMQVILETALRQLLEGWSAWDSWPAGPVDPLWPLLGSHPYYYAAP